MFSGTYTEQGDRLAFARQDGQIIDGVVTMRGANGFCFRLKKALTSDPGLKFSRSTLGLGQCESAHSNR